MFAKVYQYKFGTVAEAKVAASFCSDNLGKKISQYKLSDFEKWPKFSIQFLMARIKSHFNFPPMARSIRFKASTFHKSKGNAPILQQDGFILQLDKEIMEVIPTDIVEAIQNKPVTTEKDVLTELDIQER